MSQIHTLRLVSRPIPAPAPLKPDALEPANLCEFQDASNALSMASYYLRSGQLLGAQHKARVALAALHRLYSAGHAAPAEFPAGAAGKVAAQGL